MELLADRDPEEARRLLDPVLEHMMEAVHHYEGTVNQVMGDGIMALFGAPLAHEDHARRACYAALRMLASVERYGDAARRSHGVPIQIRVGLNSGEVGPRHRRRPAHGLHRGGADDPPGGPHGADGQAGLHPPGAGNPGSRRGIRAGPIPGGGVRQGARRPRGGLRAGGRHSDPDAPAGRRRAGPHPPRRTRRRARAHAPSPRAGAGRARTGRRPRGRAGCGQIPAGMGARS
ncbi:MAG: adenylate/guanylate cyclase domain-containing protein [Candidatus Rokubacteria bacterium]|nr:adenylate/guanylate cyclase domain-containing protein [Candidatus Rokubacteria bacterium]